MRLQNHDLGFINQWLVSVLLGALNIEQTKVLHHKSLKFIIGKTVKKLGNQRLQIKELATKENREKILKFNGNIIQVLKRKDIYYDPHSIHYTGDLNILFVWCAGIRLADKGILMDFMHTSDGFPVYFDTTDNFYDLRERFFVNIKEFRKLMGYPIDEIITYIIDRGIFSMDVFSEIIRSPFEHIITWEKDYNKDKWDSNKVTQSGNILRYRNNSKDVRLFHYQFQDGIWDKNPEMRQIIVRIFDNTRKVKIEVSILTDDMTRDAKEIVELMLKRWIQENDFKYLIKHFGINEITTYAFTDYRDVKDKVDDKLFTCKKHKALTKEAKNVRAQLKTSLLRQKRFNAKHTGSNKPLSSKESELYNEISKDVEQLFISMNNLETERGSTEKYVSKLDELIQENYQKLDTNTKSFMDAIKILARNIFYLSFQSFKNKYDNYRDDHVLFRNLTRSPGTITYINGEFRIKLMPSMEYPKRVRKILLEILQEINELSPEFPDGSKRKIRLEI